MIRPGFTITNPRTGSRTIVLESDAETGGMSWLLEVHCRPNTAPDISAHRHVAWTERFEVVSGTAHYTVDRTQQTIGAGESFVVSPNQRHVHPWNAGKTDLVYRQRSDFGSPSPEAVQEVLGVFATLADLARANRVDRRGLPKNPLQLAATLSTLTRHGGYDAALPAIVQDVIAATLGGLAVRLGYHGVDPRYTRLDSVAPR
jgi:mannose-6-phosphate isomerase-like protein (cupin superfamily)